MSEHESPKSTIFDASQFAIHEVEAATDGIGDAYVARPKFVELSHLRRTAGHNDVPQFGKAIIAATTATVPQATTRGLTPDQLQRLTAGDWEKLAIASADVNGWRLDRALDPVQALGRAADGYCTKVLEPVERSLKETAKELAGPRAQLANTFSDATLDMLTGQIAESSRLQESLKQPEWWNGVHEQLAVNEQGGVAKGIETTFHGGGPDPASLKLSDLHRLVESPHLRTARASEQMRSHLERLTDLNRLTLEQISRMTVLAGKLSAEYAAASVAAREQAQRRVRDTNRILAIAVLALIGVALLIGFQIYQTFDHQRAEGIQQQRIERAADRQGQALDGLSNEIRESTLAMRESAKRAVDAQLSVKPPVEAQLTPKPAVVQQTPAPRATKRRSQK